MFTFLWHLLSFSCTPEVAFCCDKLNRWTAMSLDLSTLYWLLYYVWCTCTWGRNDTACYRSEKKSSFAHCLCLIRFLFNSWLDFFARFFPFVMPLADELRSFISQNLTVASWEQLAIIPPSGDSRSCSTGSWCSPNVLHTLFGCISTSLESQVSNQEYSNTAANSIVKPDCTIQTSCTHHTVGNWYASIYGWWMAWQTVTDITPFTPRPDT